MIDNLKGHVIDNDVVYTLDYIRLNHDSGINPSPKGYSVGNTADT